MQQATVNIDSTSRSTMTTIGQQSHMVNRVERAFRVISDRDKDIPKDIPKNEADFQQNKEEVIEAIKEKKTFETDDLLLLGVMAFLLNERFMDQTFLSSLFWIFMG